MVNTTYNISQWQNSSHHVLINPHQESFANDKINHNSFETSNGTSLRNEPTKQREWKYRRSIERWWWWYNKWHFVVFPLFLLQFKSFKGIHFFFLHRRHRQEIFPKQLFCVKCLWGLRSENVYCIRVCTYIKLSIVTIEMWNWDFLSVNRARNNGKWGKIDLLQVDWWLLLNTNNCEL